MNTKRYIAVGDVHGQHRLLHQAVQDLDDGNTFFILLGYWLLKTE